MTVQGRRWMMLALAAAFGCGDDGTTDGPSGDGGMGVEVRYDDLYAGPCSLGDCPGRLLRTACACVAAPLDEDRLELNRVGCEELPTAGGSCDPSGASAAPDLSCFMEGSLPTGGEARMVTLFGVAEVFSNGGDTDGITIEVFEEGPNGVLGARLGVAMTSVGDPVDPCAEVELGGGAGEERQLGFYAIPAIPTETPLIVRASGDPRFWRDSYAYNVYIPNDEVDETPPAGACPTVAAVDGPVYEYRPQLMSASDWRAIPTAAGLAEGIRSDSGIVTGEIRDCGGVRLEFAQVGSSPIAVTQAYLDDRSGVPLPEPGRSEGTTLLGLYASVDVPQGPVDVTAIGRLEGQTVSLGWYRAQVFPGAVTNLTLRGLRPHQLE